MDDKPQGGTLQDFENIIDIAKVVFNTVIFMTVDCSQVPNELYFYLVISTCMPVKNTILGLEDNCCKGGEISKRFKEVS